MKKEVKLIEIGSIGQNVTKLGIYKKPENYQEIKENIEDQGIIEPLLVNNESMEIISGNLRYQIALELGIKKVPVIFEQVKDEEMDMRSISTNRTRKKSYSEILKEMKFFEDHYKIKKGQRTDLDPKAKKIKETRDALLSSTSKDTREKLKNIDRLATELFGKDSDEYKKVFNDLDNNRSTLYGMHQHLLNKKKRKHNKQVIPETYQIDSKYTKVYNKSSVDMSEVETGSVHSIITSPPYFQMRDYGTGKEQLGMESSVDIYLDNLMEIFKECMRVLADDGSLFVIINDCADSGQYNAVPHKFVIRMLDMGWILNDEILWIKNNPTYTRGKRSVRSHESIFQWVKSPKFYYNDEWLKELTDPENAISYGTNKENPKIISSLDFRDGVLRTNVANTSELRKECEEKKGFYMTHNATFPINVPTICALLTTDQEDIILDPFSGTSVVGEFARKNNRYFIGYEFKAEFVMASEVRMMKHPNPDSFEYDYINRHMSPRNYIPPKYMV